MKKLFTVFVIMILVASFALAQKKVRKVVYETVDDESGTMIAGAKFGLNFATFGGDNSSNYSGTTKFFFGGFLGMISSEISACKESYSITQWVEAILPRVRQEEMMVFRIWSLSYWQSTAFL